MKEQISQECLLELQNLGYETDGSFLSLLKLLPKKLSNGDGLLISYCTSVGFIDVEYGHWHLKWDIDWGKWCSFSKTNSEELIDAIFYMLVWLAEYEKEQMKDVKLCKTKDEFYEFIDNYPGELYLRGCNAYKVEGGDKVLVATIENGNGSK